MSPEGLENTFRDNLGETLAAEELAWTERNEKKKPTSSLPDSRRRRHCHLCGPLLSFDWFLSLHESLWLCTNADAHKHHQTPRDLRYDFAVH
jgi:hypothetical protein